MPTIIHCCGACPYVNGVHRRYSHAPELGFCNHPKLTLGDRMGDIDTSASPPRDCPIRRDPNDGRVASNAPVPAIHAALLPMTEEIP